MKTLSVCALSLCFGLAVLFGLSGCQNSNLFGGLHKRGDSSDTKTLLSDATLALRDKNYSEALDLYNRILSQDSANSEAYVGAAGALAGLSGLDVARIATNVLSNTRPPSSSVAGLIQMTQTTFSPSDAATNSILYGIDLTRLNENIDRIVCYLQKVRSGSADGRISGSDSDLNINYFLFCLIRPVLRSILAGFIDVKSINGTYTVSQGANYSTICTQDPALVKQVGKDMSNAYVILNRFVQDSSLKSDGLIADLRTDVDSVITKLLTRGGAEALPGVCLDVLETEGINVNTFKTRTAAFDPPSGC